MSENMFRAWHKQVTGFYFLFVQCIIDSKIGIISYLCNTVKLNTIISTTSLLYNIFTSPFALSRKKRT